MYFNDTTTEDGIVQEIDRICGSNNVTYPLKAKTARSNQAIDRFYTIALEEDTDWSFDDANYTTNFPIAMTNLVSGQYDYRFASELLQLQEVFVKDAAGNWTEIFNMNQGDRLNDQFWSQPTGNVGIPNRCKIFANSLLVDPVPNYSQTGGIKVIFKRNGVRFVSTDTNVTPGIPALFHSFLARTASLPYLIEKKLPQAKNVASQIVVDEDAIREFVAKRNKTARTKVIPRYRNPR